MFDDGGLERLGVLAIAGADRNQRRVALAAVIGLEDGQELRLALEAVDLVERENRRCLDLGERFVQSLSTSTAQTIDGGLGRIRDVDDVDRSGNTVCV